MFLDCEEPIRREQLRKRLHKVHMLIGVKEGWWKHWDQKGPWRTVHVSSSDIPKDAIEAHALAKSGLFKSISDARKLGFNNPIQVGSVISLKTRRTIVEITS